MSFWLFVRNTEIADISHFRLDGKGHAVPSVDSETDKLRIARFCMLLHRFLVSNCFLLLSNFCRSVSLFYLSFLSQTALDVYASLLYLIV